MSLLELIRSHQVVGVVDTFFGDSGKGKIVDWLANQKFGELRLFAAVYRPNGGPNTGHTIYVDENKYVFHLIPSAALIPDMKCFIGKAVAFEPVTFFYEYEIISNVNNKTRVCVDHDAHVIMPWHIAIDNLREVIKGKGKIGTTGKGVGPCMETKCSRSGFVTISDLANRDKLEAKVRDSVDNLSAILNDLFYKFNSNVEVVSKVRGMALDYLAKIKLINGNSLADFFKIDGKINSAAVVETYHKYGNNLKGMTWDTLSLLHSKISEKKRILVEGTQGALLDKEHGTYPYVTDGLTTRSGLEHDAGMPIDLCFNVVKAYSTRVGSGPFPTELDGELADKLREKGKEYGSTTGRPRRVGWLDAVALRYGLNLNVRRGEKSLIALTKLDVLAGFEPLICTEYKVKDYFGISDYNKNYIPMQIENATMGHHEKISEIEDIKDVKEFSNLPQNARVYINAIERLSGGEVFIVGNGPKREDIIMK